MKLPLATMAAAVMVGADRESEQPPDRLCVDKNSPHYDRRVASVGVVFDGEEMPGNVHEYCVSEGWVKVKVTAKTGTSWYLDRREGEVRPYWRRGVRAPAEATEADAARLAAAEEKRRRKAEKARRIQEKNNAHDD